MIGIDIENIERFKNLDNHLIERVYTKNEVEYCKKYAKAHIHFAGIWCAKEAVIKALTDLNLAVSEIEILHQSFASLVSNAEELVKLINNDLQNYNMVEKCIVFVSSKK